MIISILEAIQRQPIYHLSLANKELFHSNFLAWLALCTETSDYFLCIMEQLAGGPFAWHNDFLTNPTNFKIEREFRHFDLCILKKGKDGGWSPILILENKNKSVPYFEQLNRYYEDVKIYPDFNNIFFILLSLVEDFVDKTAIISQGIWKVNSYENLRVAMTNTALPSTLSCYKNNLIIDYILFIERLHNLSTVILPPTNNDYYICDSIIKELNNCRLHDLVEKVRYSKYASELSAKFVFTSTKIFSNFKEYCVKAPIGSIFVNSGYSSRGGAKGIIDTAVKIHKECILKIQIQGDQYRHAIEWIAINKSTKKTSVIDNQKYEKLRDVAINMGFFKSFFNNSISILTDPIYPTNPPKQTGSIFWHEFNSFGDGFKYQYRKIDNKVNYLDVIDTIFNDVIYIKSNIFQFSKIP